MSIKLWPAAEKPREKLLSKGASALSDAELIAIGLRSGLKGETAVDFARRALVHFGSLRKLIEADMESFCRMRGLTQTKYAELQAAREIMRRHLHETLATGCTLNSPQQTQAYLISQLRAYQHEVFACLFLDSRHRVLSFEKLFHGTINSANVYPRELVKRALFYNAAAVIFAHNHPSGTVEPSQADLEITYQLKQTLELIQVQVLDHFIIGNGQTYSFAERGLL